MAALRFVICIALAFASISTSSFAEEKTPQLARELPELELGQLKEAMTFTAMFLGAVSAIAESQDRCDLRKKAVEARKTARQIVMSLDQAIDWNPGFVEQVVLGEQIGRILEGQCTSGLAEFCIDLNSSEVINCPPKQ